MRDVVRIFAAGSLLTAYALLAPTMVEAVPGPAPTQKAFAQRLSQAGGEAPFSAVAGGRVAARLAAPGDVR